VESVFGVPYGWSGFYERSWTRLTPKDVRDFHRQGGSPLGTGRGGFDLVRIVDAIETRHVQILICIGGDGTMMGTQKIFEEVRRRGLEIAVVHVPKTVDRDIPLLSTTFGFDTCVEEATRAIQAASVEARSFADCFAIVKLMGRNAGFIAAYATLASRAVDCCLIPEVPFVLDGPGGVLEYVEGTLDRQGQCVVVIAEGAGQELVGGSGDIGRHVFGAVKAYFERKGRSVSHKYIDPTYQVRAVPAIASDNILCTLLAHAAVHGAMAGMTGCVFGPLNSHNVVFPLQEIAGRQATVDPVCAARRGLA
jgi:6-phosphofructokinase 1